MGFITGFNQRVDVDLCRVIFWGTVDTVRDYVRMKKNIAVGTTIVIDKKGVTVENEGDPVLNFTWNNI